MKRILLGALIVVAGLFLLSTPCVLAQEVCNGNFDCDQDVDGGDAANFKLSFGRSQFSDPCPTCNDSPCPCSPCPYSMIDCGTKCVDPMTDEDFCGVDLTCLGGVVCGVSEKCIVGVCEDVGGGGCLTGETRQCGTDIGECEYGTETCTDGVWGECVGEVPPTDEICDGLDNDCDGGTDEDGVCECYSQLDCIHLQEYVCENPSTCQGLWIDGECDGGWCRAMPYEDDQACDPSVEAHDCGLYLSVYCNGNFSQTPPECPYGCQIDGDCDPEAHCSLTDECLLPEPSGSSCDEHSDCMSGVCLGGSCL